MALSVWEFWRVSKRGRLGGIWTTGPPGREAKAVVPLSAQRAGRVAQPRQAQLQVWLDPLRTQEAASSCLMGHGWSLGPGLSLPPPTHVGAQDA